MCPQIAKGARGSRLLPFYKCDTIDPWRLEQAMKESISLGAIRVSVALSSTSSKLQMDEIFLRAACKKNIPKTNSSNFFLAAGRKGSDKKRHFLLTRQATSTASLLCRCVGSWHSWIKRGTPARSRARKTQWRVQKNTRNAFWFCPVQYERKLSPWKSRTLWQLCSSLQSLVSAMADFWCNLSQAANSASLPNCGSLSQRNRTRSSMPWLLTISPQQLSVPDMFAKTVATYTVKTERTVKTSFVWRKRFQLQKCSFRRGWSSLPGPLQTMSWFCPNYNIQWAQLQCWTGWGSHRPNCPWRWCLPRRLNPAGKLHDCWMRHTKLTRWNNRFFFFDNICGFFPTSLLPAVVSFVLLTCQSSDQVFHVFDEAGKMLAVVESGRRDLRYDSSCFTAHGFRRWFVAQNVAQAFNATNLQSDAQFTGTTDQHWKAKWATMEKNFRVCSSTKTAKGNKTFKCSKKKNLSHLF